MIRSYLNEFVQSQQQVLKDIPLDGVEKLIAIFQSALMEEKERFVFCNGCIASNAAHFLFDLRKSASDKMGKRFRYLSLFYLALWLTVIGYDYAYEVLYVRQSQNH